MPSIISYVIIITDDFNASFGIDKEFANHEVVNHSVGEHMGGRIHANTVEKWFNNLNRGFTGIYQDTYVNHLSAILES